MENPIKILKLLSVAGVLVLSGCASQPDEITLEEQANNKRTSLAMYKEAKKTMDDGLYNRAIQLLNHIDSAYPFGPMSRTIQLDLIYAYYKSAKNAQAIASIDRFIRLNPNDKDLDYVHYMRGLVNMGSDENFFQEVFGIDRADKALDKSREAFRDFKLLIKKFPDSKYALDARKRMSAILDKLARREIYVAQYYMKQGAYLAAANRGKYILENYPNSPRVENALEVMIESYDQLGLKEMRQDALNVLRLNYPENKLVN